MGPARPLDADKAAIVGLNDIINIVISPGGDSSAGKLSTRKRSRSMGAANPLQSAGYLEDQGLKLLCSWHLSFDG